MCTAFALMSGEVLGGVVVVVGLNFASGTCEQ